MTNKTDITDTNELIERYVHHMGHFLPQTERAEIEAELRSQIYDQLEDRYGEAPTVDEVTAMLLELGAPRRVAASYTQDQYLIGPELYPIMMFVLRYSWLLVPTVIGFLHLFGMLIVGQPVTIVSLIIEPALAALQATLIFSALVVLVFALIERSGKQVELEPFNPLELPQVGDPTVMDRFEAPMGVVVGTLVLLIFIYFLRVGGLTLRFNLNDPGEVIPVPAPWLVLLILFSGAQVILHLFMIGRKRWSISMWLTQTLFEVAGTVCLYFAILNPFFDRVITANPALTGIAFAEIIAVALALITLLSKGTKLITLWNYQTSDTAPLPVSTDHSSPSA